MVRGCASTAAVSIRRQEAERSPKRRRWLHRICIYRRYGSVMNTRPRTVRPGYAAAALLVFLTEVAIAIWLRDPLIRPYFGDSLAVVLVYLALRAATQLSVPRATIVALTTAFAVEVSQWFHLVDALGLSGDPIASAMLGTGFDPRDFLAYGLGAAMVPVAEAGLTAWRRSRGLLRRDLPPG